TPDIVGFVLANGNLKYPDLVTGNQQTQTDHDENQYFEMRIDRLHGVLSGSFRLLLHSLDRSGTGSDWTGAIVARQADQHPVSTVLESAARLLTIHWCRRRYPPQLRGLARWISPRLYTSHSI